MSQRANAKYTPLDTDGPLPLEMIRSVPAISRDPLTWLERTVGRYGDLVAFPMPRTPVLLVNAPGGARHVLQGNHPNYTKATIQYGALSAVTGQGLLTSDGPSWRRHRRAVQPAFHGAQLPALADLTIATAAASRQWDGVPFPASDARGSERPADGARLAGGGQLASGERLVDVDAASMRVMLDVVTACLFSQTAGPDGEQVITAVDQALHAVVAKARSPLAGPLARLPTPARRRQLRAVATLDDACRAVVARRRALGAGAGPADLLGLLLQAQDDGVLDGAGVRDELVTMIIAGHETVASSLAWTLNLLAGSSVVQDQLHKEIDRVLGTREPGWDDLAALPYLRAVVQESLRLYPPAWVITRRASAADDIGGVAIPAGTLVIISPWLLHRREQDWPDPLRFDPARFADAEGTDRRDGYLPFGAGPRLCIGREVALMQATLILARLMRDHRLRRPPSAAEPGVDALVTLRPRGGLPLLLSPR